MRNLRWVLNTLAKFRLDVITLTVSKDRNVLRYKKGYEKMNKGETISSLLSLSCCVCCGVFYFWHMAPHESCNIVLFFLHICHAAINIRLFAVMTGTSFTNAMVIHPCCTEPILFTSDLSVVVDFGSSLFVSLSVLPFLCLRAVAVTCACVRSRLRSFCHKSSDGVEDTGDHTHSEGRPNQRESNLQW